jgi:hypothetical protein
MSRARLRQQEESQRAWAAQFIQRNQLPIECIKSVNRRIPECYAQSCAGGFDCLGVVTHHPESHFYFWQLHAQGSATGEANKSCFLLDIVRQTAINLLLLSI